MTTPLPAAAGRCPKRLRQTGASLIEILVTLLIFSFGLVGFVGLQAKAVQYSVSAEDSNRAALLASELTALMTLSGSVALTSEVITAWKDRVSNATTGLPNGLGDIQLNGNQATITVTWQATSAVTGAANAVNKYVTEFII